MDDLKVSLRQLFKTPGFTLAATGVLALGIGLNAAMFSLVYSLAFASRPFPNPDTLVQLYSRDGHETRGYRAFSHPAYESLAARRDLFDGVLAHTLTMVGVGTGQDARRSFAAIVTENYFDVLGVPIAHGRRFTNEEARPGQDVPVAVVTHAYWARTGFDPALIGSTLRINGRIFTIVGITPRGFTGTMTAFGPELFFPMGVFDSLNNDFDGGTKRLLRDPGAFQLFVVARRRDGVGEQASADALAAYGAQLAAAYPAEYEHYTLSAGPLPRFGTSTSPSNEAVVTTLGIVLLGMTAAVLATVCLNLASMILARGRGRRKEFAIRLAIGSGRGRLVRQLLVEGLLLSFVGGALGLVLGQVAIDALVTTIARLLPITLVLSGSSPALVGAAILFCVLATATFALGPALKHSRADILTDLKTQTGDDDAPRGRRWLPRNPLVAAQVALSLALLIAAGLFLQMVRQAGTLDLGFDAQDTVIAEVDSRLGGLDEAQALAVYAQLEERLASLPGVRSAAIGGLVPMGFVNISRAVQRAGTPVVPGTRASTPETGQTFFASWNAVGANYFDAMGVRLVRGRPFTTAEAFGTGAPSVAILDETLAARLWPDGDALGQQIQWGPEASTPATGTTIEVVAIVAPVRRELFENVPRGAIYVPFAQGFLSNAHFHVRPAGPAAGLVDAVRQTVRETAPALPFYSARTFAAHVDESPEYWALKVSISTFAFFGGLAMVVALVGIYGVTAYAVLRRTREIGVRMAIGARPAAVLRLILGESLLTTVIGVALGWVLGLGVGRVMSAMFVDLDAFDPWTFALVPVGFLAAALLATWIPALRATAVNPVTALRSE